MTIHLSRPDGLLEQDGYAPAAVTTLTAGSRLLLLAGQLAVTPAGATTTTDLAGQIHAALHNVATGVRGAGGEVADIARLTCYVVGWAPDRRSPSGRASRAPRSPTASARRCHPSRSSASKRCGGPICSSRSRPPPSWTDPAPAASTGSTW